MNIQHFEKGFFYSDADLVKVATKLGKLATYCKKLKDPDSVIRVESEHSPTKKQSDQIKVMITIDLPKMQLRAESFKGKPIEALDRCIEKLEPQIAKYKAKHLGGEKKRRGRGN